MKLTNLLLTDMKISIIGTNGMLSIALTKMFMQDGHTVHTFGLEEPFDYICSAYHRCDLLKDELDYDTLTSSDIIFYASGAGVQAALNTPSSLMYMLNLYAPINITLKLKQLGYKGKYISFGSYMEIGVNDEEGRAFTEEEIICSSLPVTNDYALSKRLYGRYINDFVAEYSVWHFILPNMFSYEDKKPGTRLIPYVLQYLRDYKNGMNPKIPSFSPGTQTRQFIFLEDIKNVLDKAISSNIPTGIYNIGGGEFCSIRKTIENLFEAYGVECKEEYFGKETRRDGDIRSLLLDGDKLKKCINYLPNTKMAEILCN